MVLGESSSNYPFFIPTEPISLFPISRPGPKLRRNPLLRYSIQLNLTPKINYLPQTAKLEAGLDTGLRFPSEAFATFNLLAANWQMGWSCKIRNPKLKDARTFPCCGPIDKYLIFYQPHHDRIEIPRVLHGSQDLESLMKRSGIEYLGSPTLFAKARAAARPKSPVPPRGPLLPATLDTPHPFRHTNAMAMDPHAALEALPLPTPPLERRLDREAILATLRSHESSLRQSGIVRLSLFGSAARNQRGPSSDIDLLAAYDDSRRISLLDIVGIQLSLSQLLAAPVDLVEEGTLKPRIRPHVLSEAIRAF